MGKAFWPCKPTQCEAKLKRMHERKKFFFLPERPPGRKRNGKTLLLRPWGRDEDLADSDDEYTHLYWSRCRACGLDRTVTSAQRTKYAPQAAEFVCGFVRKICNQHANEYERVLAGKAAPREQRE